MEHLNEQPHLTTPETPEISSRVDQFDQMKEGYGKFVDADPMRNIHYDRVMEALGELKDREVLDVGCGSGAFDRKLAEAGAHVTAFDDSPNLIEEAKKKEGEQPLGITYLEANATNFETSHSFDNAVSVLVLPYMADEEQLGQAFAATAQALKPEGEFVSAVINPNFHAFGEIIGNRRFTLLDSNRVQVEFLNPENLERALPPVELSQYSAETYEKAATENGFQVVEWKELQPTDTAVERLGEDFWTEFKTKQPYALLIAKK